MNLLLRSFNYVEFRLRSIESLSAFLYANEILSGGNKRKNPTDEIHQHNIESVSRRPDMHRPIFPFSNRKRCSIQRCAAAFSSTRNYISTARINNAFAYHQTLVIECDCYRLYVNSILIARFDRRTLLKAFETKKELKKKRSLIQLYICE